MHCNKFLLTRRFLSIEYELLQCNKQVLPSAQHQIVVKRT